MNALKKWPHSPLFTIIMMIPLVSFYSFSLDLYIPLLPKIGHDLNSSMQQMQYTNSLFMLFCGIGQLVFGPLSDRYGRLNVLQSAIAIFITANCICYFANSYSALILGRTLQAIGACGSYLCCFATIRDIYEDDNDSAAMFSYLNISNSISAIIAPSLGTIIGSLFGWQYIFSTLAISCALSYCCYRILAVETASKTADNKQIINEYIRVFKHVNYQLFTLPAAIGIGTFFAYYCISSYLYIEVMGFSTLEYGMLYGTCGLAFFIGSYVCGQSIMRVGILNTLFIGLSFHAMGAIYLLTCYLLTSGVNILCIHPGILLMIWGAAFMVGAGIGGTMAPFKDIPGTTFAMISCYKFLAAHSIGDLVMHYYDNTIFSLAIIVLALNIISSLLLWTFQNGIVYSNAVKNMNTATT